MLCLMKPEPLDQNFETNPSRNTIEQHQKPRVSKKKKINVFTSQQNHKLEEQYTKKKKFTAPNKKIKRNMQISQGTRKKNCGRQNRKKN